MRDNRYAHFLAHAQYSNLRETIGDSLLATIISVASGIVVVPLACSNFNFLHLVEQCTFEVLLWFSVLHNSICLMVLHSMPREMPEHIFGYNKSKQMRIIHPPLSPNKYSKFSSVRVLSIQYEMRGSSVQSASSNHRAHNMCLAVFSYARWFFRTISLLLQEIWIRLRCT